MIVERILKFADSKQYLGKIARSGENNTRSLTFDCSMVLAEYPNAQIIAVIQRPQGDPYTVTPDTDGTIRRITLTAYDLEYNGHLQIELRVIDGDKVLKSAIYTAMVDDSIRGEADAPGQPVRDVLDRLDGEIKQAQAVVDDIRQKLDNGEFNGSDATVTAANIEAALGYAPVKDVQVMGSSVLADGVANVPLANETGFGVVKVPGSWNSGLYVNQDNGALRIIWATDADISGRENIFRPIVSGNLDKAVKAAMCDGKGAAWTVAEQKAARDRMGVDKEYELIEEITLAEESSVERTTEPDGTPYNFAVIMLRAEFPAIEKTGNIYILYHIGNYRQSVASYFLSPYNANAVKYGYSKVWVENSRYRSGWWSCVENRGKFAQYYENPVQQDEYSVADGNIVSFRTDVIAAGAKITIYGVRAQ